VRRPRTMRTSGIRFVAAGFLVLAGLLASCSAAHVRPGTQSRAGTQSQAGGRPAGTRASAHAQATAGTRLQISRGPWWQREDSPCAPPALVRAAGHLMGVGTCNGQLSRPPQKVTLIVGQRIDVHMQEAEGVWLPHSSYPSVLMPGARANGCARNGHVSACRLVHNGVPAGRLPSPDQ
jgi:hypothetical protein